jgi:ABC-type oligopeptide transport system substrate-binding subunit
VKWYTSEGAEYAELTAKDFEAGFHHMLDAAAGLEWLVQGKIAGVDEYLLEGGSWDNVGYKAVDDYTLEITLVAPLPYFMTMLTYSCFLPICDSFYQSRGGVYGIDEYAAASQSDSYKFGLQTDVSSQVYCGPFLLQKLQKDSEILVVKNPNYYNADKVVLNSIKWVYDDGSNPIGLYNEVMNGNLVSIGLSEGSGTLKQAKDDGNFDQYAYVTDTTSTSYFGGLNLNRGTFQLESGACASPADEQAHISTNIALNNKAFRLAIQYAWDHQTMNAVAVGQDLSAAALRNMYTAPEFVRLTNDTTDADGHTFAAGTVYGDLVQYYVTEVYKMPIDVHDGTNGWYRPDDAKAMLAKAEEQLGDAVTYPVQIDVVFLGTSANNTNMAKVFKQSIEGVLGADKVQVNLIEAGTTEDFYACGYRASNGEAGNYDMFYGSGWGPDYGDPSTYLDTFRGLGAGYMTKVIGLF